MKTFTTQEQIQNCETFLHYWKSVPEGNVSPGLSDWVENKLRDDRVVHDCGTVACAGGWLTAMPEFVELGVRQGPFCRPTDEDGVYQDSLAYKLFGDHNIFSIRMIKTKDTDHECVTKRFESQIEFLEGELLDSRGR